MKVEEYSDKKDFDEKADIDAHSVVLEEDESNNSIIEAVRLGNALVLFFFHLFALEEKRTLF